MEFLEKHLEDIIYDQLPEEYQELEDRGYPIDIKPFLCKKQLRIGEYGVCDLLTATRLPKTGVIVITLHEFKKDEINIKTLLQSCRYVKGIKRYMKDYHPELKYIINIILCGRVMSRNGDFLYLFDSLNISNVVVVIYEYSINGLYFSIESPENYNLTKESFSKNKKIIF